MCHDNATEEIWKPVPGYEGLYEASTLGHVRSLSRMGVDGRRLHGRLLSDRLNNNGYPSCVLCKDGKYSPQSIHRVIATTFLQPSNASFTTHHRNGIRSDNRVANLQLCAFSEHARHHLVANPLNNRGSKNGQSKLTDDIVLAIRKEYASGTVLQRDLAERYSVSRCHVSDIVNRKRWRHI